MAEKRRDYIKVSIKRELLEYIKKFIKENPQLGYRSLAQFVEDAVRRRADEFDIFERRSMGASPIYSIASRVSDSSLRRLMTLLENKEEKKKEVGGKRNSRKAKQLKKKNSKTPFTDWAKKRAKEKG